MMVTVQIMSGTVEADRTNGSNQSRYHGYTTGAHRSVAAMGHADASADNAEDFVLIQTAVKRPTSSANPTISCGAATRSSVANTGSLKRNRCTNVPSEPSGILQWFKNGTYSSPTTLAAKAASRTRTRRP